MIDDTLTPSPVEQLLRDAHIQRMRGHWGAAEELVRRALETDENDAQGHEMLGDLLLEKGSLAEALASFRRAQELAPERAGIEEKIARTVLRQSEEERERLEAQLLLDSPTRQQQRKRATNIAVLMSFLCPGAGQFFNGQPVKAGVLLVLWLSCLILGGSDLVKFLIGLSVPLRRGTEVNGVLVMFGAMSVLFWMYGLMDAATQAGKGKRQEF